MRQLKYKIPGLLLALSLLVISNGIDGSAAKYGVSTLAVIGVVILAYLVTKDITEYISITMSSRESTIDKFALELKTTIEKYSDEQSKNANQLIEVVEKFNGSTIQYMDKVDSLVTIQNSIIDEGKVLIGEVQSLNTDIQKLLEKFCTNIDSNISEIISSINTFYQVEEKIMRDTIDSINKQNENHKQNIEKILTAGIEKSNKNVVDAGNYIKDTLEAFCSDFSKIQQKANENEAENMSALKIAIEEYMNKYEVVLNETKDSLNAVKSQVKVSLDQANKAIQEQTTSIEDGFEDCTYEIGAKLGDFSKDQKNRDNEQNTKLNEEINAIEQVVSSQIGQVLEANRKLLDYIQRVQEEWTSLSKDEIAFLDKVWNE